MRRLSSLLACVFLSSLHALAFSDERALIDDGWRFQLGDPAGAENANYDDTEWRSVDLPHDWGVEHPPAKDAASTGGGGYHRSGVGWYRRVLPPVEAGRRLRVRFDGAYQHAQVWLNGKRLGDHAYGYTPFSFDLTEHAHAEQPNVLAVRVDNSAQPNCRWYSGSGLYRHVWLCESGPVALRAGGVWLRTESLSDAAARAHVDWAIENTGDQAAEVVVDVSLVNNGGEVVAQAQTKRSAPAGEATEASTAITVPKPSAWSPDSPVLYTLEVSLRLKGEESSIDRVTQRVGLRTVEINATRGLVLNGQSVKMFGGNVHHDHGPLGAASFDDAERRKARLLKEAGFNAVRTSHNPPAEAFLDACDALGILVIDEAFDGWRKHKVEHDYGDEFDEHWREDLAAMVRRDRRHPSVVVWSVGNEMFERGEAHAAEVAAEMAQLVRELDPTRPVAVGVNGVPPRPWSDLDPLFAPLDVAGYNYAPEEYAKDQARLPQRVIIGTESYPAKAFTAWKGTTTQPWVIGDFVWSAIDYLGEAGLGRAFPPGQEPKKPWEADMWPWRGAGCGDIDLVGHRKPISHERNIVWDRGEKLYAAVVAPVDGEWGLTPWSFEPAEASWTWEVERGAPLKLVVASRWPSVRVELNGRVVDEAKTTEAERFRATFTVPYEPGELSVVGLDENGADAERQTLRTAKPAARLKLTPDRTTAPADRQSLAYVDVELVDSSGVVQTTADRVVRFKVDGAATLQAVGSGDLTNHEVYAGEAFTTHHGRVLAIVRGDGSPGVATVTAEADGLPAAQLELVFSD